MRPRTLDSKRLQKAGFAATVAVLIIVFLANPGTGLAAPASLPSTLTSFTWSCSSLDASGQAWTEHRFAADGAVTTLRGESTVATGRWQLSGPRMVKVQHRAGESPFFLNFDAAFTNFEALDGQGVRRYRGTRKAPVAVPVAPPITVPSAMAARMSAERRQQMMNQFGAKKKSEGVVMRGLRWLVTHQNPDGSWAPNERAAMTGFGLLSFLGRGETPDSAEFGPAVRKAVDWLVENGQNYDGRLSMTKEGWGSNSAVYSHAIATCALGEYYAMTKDERVAPLLRQAVNYIVEGQGPDGGWMYGYDRSQSDTSVSGWQIQALRAAHLTGLNIEGMDAALDKAMLNLKRVQTDVGGFGYRKAEDRPGGGGYSLCGVGVLCSYMWKQDKNDGLVRDGIKFMLDKGRPPVKYKGDNADLYAWYYNTQACFMVGGDAWTRWNRMFQDEICDNQSPDGSWPPVNGGLGGEALKSTEGYGPFYRTNLCILMLEVFYRYKN